MPGGGRVGRIGPDDVDLSARVDPVVRPGRPGALDIALEAHEQAEMGDRVRQGVDFVDPVLMPAIGGQQMVHRLARPDIRDHRIRADLLALRRPHADDPVVLDQKRLDLGVRPRFAARLRDRRQDVLGKGRAAALGIPGAALPGSPR